MFAWMKVSPCFACWMIRACISYYKALKFQRNEEGDRMQSGQGAFGVVHRATCADRPVAVKEFARGLFKEPKYHDMFRREVHLPPSSPAPTEPGRAHRTAGPVRQPHEAIHCIQAPHRLPA